MFTPHHVSHVTCHMSHVACHMSYHAMVLTSEFGYGLKDSALLIPQAYVHKVVHIIGWPKDLKALKKIFKRKWNNYPLFWSFFCKKKTKKNTKSTNFDIFQRCTIVFELKTRLLLGQNDMSPRLTVCSKGPDCWVYQKLWPLKSAVVQKCFIAFLWSNILAPDSACTKTN